MSRAVLFANGRIHDAESVRGLLREGDVLIAADGGTRHVLLLGLVPSVLIGDLDSVGEIERKRVETGGGQIVQHPRDKNETDLELALGYAAQAGYEEILVIGALGGRLDQTLGNLSILSGDEYASLNISIDDGLERARFTRERVDIQGYPGETVSLLPWRSDVTGITTAGLRWPLRKETLSAQKTRGISNELVGTQASISIASGVLLVIQRRNQNLAM